MLGGYWSSVIGGVGIGAAAGVCFIGIGRILGVSGIVGGLFTFRAAGNVWRWAFLAGLVLTGFVSAWGFPGSFGVGVFRTNAALFVAGSLVGFGTRLGSGCTSGHGVCGVGRLSRRSLVATCVSIATGALVVWLIERFRGGVI